jgi:hypothetical protein
MFVLQAAVWSGKDCRVTCTAAAHQDCGRFFPPGLFDDGRPGRGRAAWPAGWPALSGKFAVLAAMLERLRPTGERIVIVSNYTQTLDLFMQLCRDRGVRAPRAPAACLLPARGQRFLRHGAFTGPGRPCPDSLCRVCTHQAPFRKRATSACRVLGCRLQDGRSRHGRRSHAHAMEV